MDIQIFKDAVNELLLQGFTVFRVGKTSNQSLNIDNKNYFDLTNNEHDDFVDVYLGANCYICITTSSGFDSTPYVFRKNMFISKFLFLIFSQVAKETLYLLGTTKIRKLKNI